MPVKINIGDVLELRKSHPCGGNVFEVMRCGMDFRIKCLKCQKQVWVERDVLEKRIKSIKINENI